MHLESIEYREMTAGEVLALLRRIPDLDPDLIAEREIEFDTTLSMWAKWWKCPQVPGTVAFARSLFDSEISAEDWQWAVEPRDQRTVRDVCEVIAKATRVPIVPKVSILGTPCRNAGAFLLIKILLADTGVNVSEVSPSTPLSKFCKRGFPRLRKEIGLLCPELWGQLGAVDWRPLMAGSAIASLSLWLVFIDVRWLCDFFLWAIFWSIVSLGVIRLLEALRILNPFDRVRFPRMRTFRDLSIAIANESHSRGGSYDVQSSAR